ncbi:putative secreted protein [Pseudoduganella flava]|uniref:PEP-CTERM sorting domain-containing protein n=1 Tax=Pseudoduganella flava TaxID=871742 RepID=A0A562PRF3_9BURK|nr:PEP-CTERM sorting domain-containing protein [Pseudoduganella flava]QGZ37822.1 PEP-CTERM sorting domain-containing protein [Pseudoduganella flava]TWI46646.1 putative secreted protein [Pseudoduganella flava]
MLKKLLGTVALCVATGTASAADTVWQFGYTGFQRAETGQFVATEHHLGAFSGKDVDGDGVLQQSELSRFWVDSSRDLIGPDECKAIYNSCELTGFSYDLRSGELTFTASTVYRDEAAASHYEIVAGSYVSADGYTPTGSGSVTWLWTDQTRFEITPAPVPEPATAWLLGIGLAAVGVAARRRR